MAFQPSADSVGIRRLWHPGQSNDAIASEPSIFSENHNYKRFFRVAVNTYVPIFRGLDVPTVRGGHWWHITTNRHTHVHAHTHAGQLKRG